MYIGRAQLSMLIVISALLTGLCGQLHGLPQMPQFSMPKMPTISMPKISIPKVSLPKVSMPTRESFSNLSMPKFSRPKMTVADVRSMVGRHKGKAGMAAVALLALGGTELASAILENNNDYRKFLKKWINDNKEELLKNSVMRENYSSKGKDLIVEDFYYVSNIDQMYTKLKDTSFYIVNPNKQDRFFPLHPSCFLLFNKEGLAYKHIDSNQNNLRYLIKFLIDQPKDFKKLQLYEKLLTILRTSPDKLSILLLDTRDYNILITYNNPAYTPEEMKPFAAKVRNSDGTYLEGDNLWGKALTDIRDQVKKKMPSRFYLYWKYLTGSE